MTGKIYLEIDKIKDLGFIIKGLEDSINGMSLPEIKKQSLLHIINEIRKFLELNSREVKR